MTARHFSVTRVMGVLQSIPRHTRLVLRGGWSSCASHPASARLLYPGRWSRPVVARPDHVDWCGNTSDRLLHLAWSRWGAHAARGIVRVNNCKPSCAEGTSHRYKAKVRLHRVVKVNGHPRFVRVTLRILEGPYRGKNTLPLPRKPYN